MKRSKAHYADEGSIVEVYWVDSCGPTKGWSDLADLDLEPAVVRTGGIVVNISDEAVTLILSHHQEGESFDGAITIPQVAITSWSVVWPAK